jgi:hypothetical protein
MWVVLLLVAVTLNVALIDLILLLGIIRLFDIGILWLLAITVHFLWSLSRSLLPTVIILSLV